MAVNADVSTGKNVSVTGHTGFQRNWFAMWPHDRGARVVGYALRLPAKPGQFELARVQEPFASYHPRGL